MGGLELRKKNGAIGEKELGNTFSAGVQGTVCLITIPGPGGEALYSGCRWVDC